MAGRGATTFQKRQKEQNRKEKREEKLSRRAERKTDGPKEPIIAPEPVNPDLDRISIEELLS